MTKVVASKERFKYFARKTMKIDTCAEITGALDIAMIMALFWGESINFKNIELKKFKSCQVCLHNINTSKLKWSNVFR